MEKKYSMINENIIIGIIISFFFTLFGALIGSIYGNVFLGGLIGLLIGALSSYYFSSIPESRLPLLKKRKIMRLLLRALPFPVPAPELYDILIDLKKSSTDFDIQVNEAVDAIKKSSRLVKELEENLKERSARIEELRTEYEKYSELAEIEQEKAKRYFIKYSCIYSLLGYWCYIFRND